MAPPSSAPNSIHVVEPEYCPQAVIDWYERTGGSQVYKYAGNGSKYNSDLCTKAKKHLSALGWTFWYADKKGKRELRYQSPKNGKNYISLKTACKSCIEDGGLYIPFKTEDLSHVVQPSSTTAISSSSEEPHTKQQRKHKKTRIQARKYCSRKIRKRKKNESSEDEWSPELNASNKRSKVVLRSSKRVRHESSCSDSSVRKPSTIPFKTEDLAHVVVVQPSSKQSSEEAHTRQPRKYKKTRVQARKCSRKIRKRKKRESSEDEWSPELNGSNKRSKVVLRSSKRVRHESSCSDSSLRKPSTITSWLIDNKVVVLEAEVFCCGGNNNVVKKGRILRSGIVCSCCGTLFSPTRFEAHAGCTKHRPSATIFLEDGRSLKDCSREALNISQHHDFMIDQGNSTNTTNYQDQSDSICSVCHYGGDIMLCDRCPSVFHHTCLGLEKVPDGDWFCPSCCCKICNQTRYSEDCEADNVDNSVLVCDQCERKYHIGCLKNRGFNADENWFCNSDCENIFFSLQKLIGKPIPVGSVADNLTLTFLKKIMKSDYDLSEIESKLSVALGVMHECFEPIIDVLSRRDIVADVIFSRSSDHNRLNFRGFYTVILERNDEVISVATIRIFGQRVAEVPLIATRSQFRRQGMCRILMNELENMLTQFGVERIILPAAHEVVDTWTNSFGFATMTNADKSQFRDFTFLDFQDSTVCHKPLMKKP